MIVYQLALTYHLWRLNHHKKDTYRYTRYRYRNLENY